MNDVQIGGVLVDKESLANIDPDVVVQLVADHGGPPADAIEAAMILWDELENSEEMVADVVDLPEWTDE